MLVHNKSGKKVVVCTRTRIFLSLIKAGVFKTFEWFCFSLKYEGVVKFSKQRFVLSSSFLGFVKLSKQKFVLPHSFLNFLRTFFKFKVQFLGVWENFAPAPGIRPSFFAPG